MKKLVIITCSILFSILALASEVSAASFNITPSNAQFVQQCESIFDIFINTEGESSNSADLKINYNQSAIVIIDADPTRTGTQIVPGDAYENYVGNSVNTVSGEIRLAGLSLNSNLNGNALFARVRFQTNPGVTSASFNIQFTGVGDTLDSNVAESTTSNDILTSVTNGTFTFSSTSCIPDNTPPSISYNYPQANQSNVPADSNIQISITDSASSIDLNTLQIVVHDKVYNSSSPEVSITGSGQNYTITINPLSNLPAGEEIVISVSVSDIRGNAGASSITYNRQFTATPTPTPPPPSPSCGEVCSEDVPCAGGLSCDNGLCKILDCVGRECTCNVTLQQCGGECIDDSDCEANLFCSEGLCRIVSCLQDGVEDCACTPPVLQCEAPPNVLTPIVNVVESVIRNETIVNIVEGANRVYTEYVPQPIRSVVDRVSAPGFLTGLVSIGLVANVLSFLVAVRSPQLLLLLIGLYFDKRRKPWGIVYDVIKNKPLPFASIRVFLRGTKTLVEQRVTDSEGRYGLILPAGKYRLEAEHPDFMKQTLEVTIQNDNDIVPNDIELTPKDSKSKKNFALFSFFRGINEFFLQHMSFFIYFGLVTSLIAILISFNAFNLVMLVLYGASAILYTVNTQQGVKRWGQVVDSKTNLKIPFAIVKLFDRNNWKMIDTQMTNSNGGFGLFNEPGKYAILVSAKGYTFPSKIQKDLKPIPDKFGLLELDIFKKKDLKITLLVDPTASGKKSILKVSNPTEGLMPGVSNLASPFGT